MKKTFIQVLAAVSLAVAVGSCVPSQRQGKDMPEEISISKSALMDKIKGAWAGQTIGCAYGGPTEFRYCGTMIQPYIPIHWSDGCIKNYMVHSPGLYDDIYMDLTFVEVMDRLGIDAPVDSFAVAFANAGYSLWHANQAARYNILHGIMPPESGNWKNNPHADDIDYQIEADYAGIMSPGMPNAASEISDKIGHIMNSGDGWYGGVYVGAMYALAFVSDDIEYIVEEALKTIPAESRFHQCMSDVIGWHRQYPDDWKQTWFECERKYSEDIGCPEGVFVPYNIDASLNCAYILIGLLYGNGNFAQTLDISTRCGLDSDCNPASAGGILGTMLGYSHIPEYWMKNVREAEDMNFAYTSTSLNKASRMSFDQALQVIQRNGGCVTDSLVTIECQQPTPVRLEKNFEGLYPIKRANIRRTADDFGQFDFEGTGFVLRGALDCANKDYVAKVAVFVDGNQTEVAELPANSRIRRQEITWKYDLPKGTHTVTLKWENPEKDAVVRCHDAIVYSDAPIVLNHQ